MKKIVFIIAILFTSASVALAGSPCCNSKMNNCTKCAHGCQKPNCMDNCSKGCKTGGSCAKVCK